MCVALHHYVCECGVCDCLSLCVSVAPVWLSDTMCVSVMRMWLSVTMCVSVQLCGCMSLCV